VWGKSHLLVVAAGIGLCAPSGAAARMISPWGSPLSAAPTVDTANGASHASGDRPTRREITPYPHDGSDIALWNTRVAGGRAVAPRGGQVREVRLKGCAVEDPSAPTQRSLGVPVNTIEFQTLMPAHGGAYRATATAGLFRLPFCSNSTDPARGRISTATITTFRPIHLCIGRGGTVDLYGLGGFVPSPGGLGWYPEGVPLEILAGVHGSASIAFVDADVGKGRYSPGARPRGPHSGWGYEPGFELMLQAVEGVGADAYGLCPGGTAEEPSSSNAVICAVRPPYDGHRSCGRAADRPRTMLVN
jgi:hypothetical protein